VQLFDNGHVQTLLRQEQLNVAPSPGWRDGGIKNRLRESAARKSKRLVGRLSGSLSALIAAEEIDPQIGQRDCVQNEPVPCRFFNRDPRLLNRRVAFQRPGECGVQRDGRGRDAAACQTDHQQQNR
jgi:hypothetical protein